MTHQDDPSKNPLMPQSSSSSPVRRAGGAAYNLSQLVFTIMLTSTKPMTPTSLASDVAPYLKAVADLQHIVNKIKRRRWPGVEVLSISKASFGQNSPLTAQMRGVVDAVAFMQTIVNWRRKQADWLTPHNGANPAATDLHEAKVQLALDLLAKISPRLDETQKIIYVARLLEPLEVLVSSSLEVGAYDSEDFM